MVRALHLRFRSHDTGRGHFHSYSSRRSFTGEIPDARRVAILKQLADWYRNDASSGVHGASGWLLRQRGQAELARKVDQTAVPYWGMVTIRDKLGHCLHDFFTLPAKPNWTSGGGYDPPPRNLK
jgi:hypothetical protein